MEKFKKKTRKPGSIMSSPKSSVDEEKEKEVNVLVGE